MNLFLVDSESLPGGQLILSWYTNIFLFGTGLAYLPAGASLASFSRDMEQEADNTKEGRYINSGMINGLTYDEAIPKLLNWLEEKDC